LDKSSNKPITLRYSWRIQST